MKSTNTTKFKIGFQVNKKSKLVGKTYDYIRDKYDLEPISKYESMIQDGMFLEFPEKKFYNIFKIYNEIKYSDTLISSFNIPKTLPKRFDWKDIESSENIELLDNPSKNPQTLKSYLNCKKYTKQIKNNYAVIKGSPYYVYYIMAIIRDENIDDPVKYAQEYDLIYDKYNLPSLTPIMK